MRGLDKVEEAGRRLAQPLGGGGTAAARPAEAGQSDKAPAPPVALRPPGALDDPDFAHACTACAECVAACPARCIEIGPLGDRTGGGQSLPYIIARQSPCVICDDLSCMKACPTGALQLVATAAAIDMGHAAVDLTRCLRGAEGDDEDCRLCVQQCPVGETALAIDHRGLVEVRPGCVGCGVCERACPTEPASITILPRPS